MQSIHLDQILERELVPGYHVRFVHSDNVTLAYWRVETQASLPVHSHPHEQIVNLLEGQFELTVAGEKVLLSPGQVVLIPPNAPHAGRALTDCRILDVFYPVREGYR